MDKIISTLGGQKSFLAAGWSRDYENNFKKSVEEFSKDVPSGEEYFTSDAEGEQKI